MATYTTPRHRVQYTTTRLTTPPSGASNSRAARKILSRVDGIADSPIPRTDDGVIDTMKLRLDIRRLLDEGRDSVIERDIEDLLRSGRCFRAHIPWNTRHREQHRLVRHEDGVRISVYEKCVTVEGSLPRVLGLTNVTQAQATDHDAVELLNEARYSLLPRTTERCEMERYDQRWHVVRLDLSVNFAAQKALLIEALRHVRHPLIRKAPDIYGNTGVAIFGSDRDFIVYDTHERLRRSKLRVQVGYKLLELSPPGTMRFEFRFKCAKSVRTFLSAIRARAEQLGIGPTIALPFATVRADRGTVVSYAPVRNWLLHEALASEVLALTGRRALLVPEGDGSFIQRCAVAQLAEHPELFAMLESTHSRPTVRKYRRLLAAHFLREQETNLLQLAWPTRQSAATRSRIAT